MKSNNWIKTYVIQILPALALFVYIVGFAYYIVYYYQFGINIISYITLTEVLISTLIPFIFILTYSAIAFSMYFLFRSVFKRYICIFRRLMFPIYTLVLNISCIKSVYNKIKLIKQHYKEKERLESHYTSVFSVTISFILCSIVLPICIYMDKIIVEYKYFIIIMACSITFPALNKYIQRCRRIRFEIVKSYHIITSIIMVYLSILVCAVILGIYNAQKDKLISQKQFCILTINNNEYTSDKYCYVGECGNALFLYSFKDDRTIVLNRPNVVSIIYNTKSNDLYNKFIDDFKALKEKSE